MTSHGHSHSHSHDPGSYDSRELPGSRDYSTRAFTVGIGGPVGSGKTALVLALCRRLTDYSVAVVTNDIFTTEDRDFLTRNNALESGRIRAVETGKQYDKPS